MTIHRPAASISTLRRMRGRTMQRPEIWHADQSLDRRRLRQGRPWSGESNQNGCVDANSTASSTWYRLCCYRAGSILLCRTSPPFDNV